MLLPLIHLPVVVPRLSNLHPHFFLPLSDSQNEDSARMLRHLELVDGEAADYGVRVVKLEDGLMAKKYGHRNPPGLGYFRQGDYVKYDGGFSDHVKYT